MASRAPPPNRDPVIGSGHGGTDEDNRDRAGGGDGAGGGEPGADRSEGGQAAEVLRHALQERRLLSGRPVRPRRRGGELRRGVRRALTGQGPSPALDTAVAGDLSGN